MPMTSERQTYTVRLMIAIERLHALTENQREDLQSILRTGERREEKEVQKLSSSNVAIFRFPELLDATRLPFGV